MVLVAKILIQWEYVILYFASASILSGVSLSFLNKRKQPETPIRRERNSVATLSMTVFFVVVFLIGRLDVGRMPMSEEMELVNKLVGCLLVIVGAVLNLAGRVALGRFWSDQIEILEEHEIIRDWPYNWSRHPMYGSLVIFGVGMGLLAVNPFVLAATLILFLPAMKHRACREEINLCDTFSDEYRRYQREIPMIIPHFPESLSKIARGGIATIQVWAALFQLLDVFLLSALFTLGLSFLMQRDDFRIAYKIKPIVIIICVGLAAMFPSLAILLWIPTFSTLMSLTGQCPGTLLIRAINRHRNKVLA